MKAVWNNAILAESDKTIVVERNHYFPAESVNTQYLRKSGNHYQCHWKGLADYYDIVVNGETLADGSWMYPEPTEPAKRIKGYFAFWKGVKINE